MKLSEKQAAFCTMFARLVEKANELGTPFKVCEWHRTLETQRQYVASGRSKTLDSKHLDGLAVDIAIVVGGNIVENPKGEVAPEYVALGKFWEEIGGRWGGRFGDHPATSRVEGWDGGHFEYA